MATLGAAPEIAPRDRPAERVTQPWNTRFDRRKAKGFSAYAPDLLGRVGIGATRDEVDREMWSTMSLRIRNLREYCEPILHSPHTATVVDIGLTVTSTQGLR